MDGHSSTVKGKGEENILSLMTLKLRSKHSFGQRKGVTNVQVTIRIGIRKGHQERVVFVVIWVGLVSSLLFPHFLNFNLIGTKGVTFHRPLGSNCHVCHGFRGVFCFGHVSCILVRFLLSPALVLELVVDRSSSAN